MSFSELQEIKYKYKIEYYNSITLEYIEGVEDSIKSLSNKYRLAIASSSNMESILHTLKIGNLNEYFEVLYSGEDVEESKPNPEIYIKTARDLNLNPYECIVIEDSYNGIKSAKAAGMTVIALKHEKYPMDLSEADYVCNSHYEIHKLIDSFYNS